MSDKRKIHVHPFCSQITKKLHYFSYLEKQIFKLNKAELLVLPTRDQSFQKLASHCNSFAVPVIVLDEADGLRGCHPLAVHITVQEV